VNSADAEKVAELVESLLGKLKVSSKTVTAIRSDTDWAFVIKLQSMVEASLNHLIIRRLGDDRLADIIARLEVGDPRTGKLAFVKALSLLTDPCRSFIKIFGEIRNQLAHRVENLDFNLSDYLSKMEQQRRKDLLNSMRELLPSAQIDILLQTKPRIIIFASVCMVLCQIEECIKGFSSRKELPHSTPEESNPKE
jgi:hypothetical protein